MLQISDCDSSDSNDSIDRKKNLIHKKKTFFVNNFFAIFFTTKKNSQKNSKTQIVMKLKFSNCDKTQKLKL